MKHPFALSADDIKNQENNTVTPLKQSENQQVAGGQRAITLALGLGEGGDAQVTTLALGIGEGGTTPINNTPITLAYGIGEGGSKPSGSWFNRFWGW